MAGNYNTVARQSLRLAEHYINLHNYGQAFAHFLIVLKLTPEKKPYIKDNFILALRKLADKLERDGQMEQLSLCYNQAMELFPECETVLNNMGAQLFRLGYVDEAASCFRKAINIDPGFLRARQNLENVCGHLVERWHFRMLNDTARNCAFRNAIFRAVQDLGHSTVLDIGSGTGLLSMVAVQAGAQEVYSCEMSKTMYEMSCDVISANHFAENITIFHKKSTDLKVPVDISKRVSLVVTETVDAGLLGEHILSTLKHAWANLLLPPAEGNVIKSEGQFGRVIPAGATVYVCAIESESIRAENRLLYPVLRNLDFVGSEVIGCHGNIPEDAFTEPYTSERLKTLRGGYKKISDDYPVMDFNFNNPKDVAFYCEGFTQCLELSVTTGGHLDALVLWFDLHVDDETMVSSNPTRDSCWEQAVFPVHASHLEGQGSKGNLYMRDGTNISVMFQCKEDYLYLQCTRLDRRVDHLQTDESSKKSLSHKLMSDTSSESSILRYQKSDTLSIHKGTDLFALKTVDKESNLNNNGTISTSCTTNSNDVKAVLFKNPCLDNELFVIPGPYLRRLNDLEFNTACCSAIENLQSTNVDRLSVIDISQGFSPLGLQAVMFGAVEVCIAESSSANQRLVQHLITTNCIPEGVITFSNRHFEDYDTGQWNTLIADVVEPCGTLRQQVLEDIALAKATCLTPDAVIIPGSVSLYAMIIHSDDLLTDSAVKGRPLGLKIREFMNDFQMTTHVDIDLATLSYTKLSAPFHLFTFDFNDTAKLGCIPEVLSQTNDLSIPVIDSGIATAIVYWFKVQISSKIEMSTLDQRSHWRQAAVMQRDQLHLVAGTTLTVNAICSNSCVDIYCH